MPAHSRAVTALFVSTLSAATTMAAPPVITVHTANPHGMRYTLALPSGRAAPREWPVVVVIPDAAREFAANLEAFVAARGNRPYILVAPEVLTSGGARSRTPDRYTYAPAVWDSLQRIDDF